MYTHVKRCRYVCFLPISHKETQVNFILHQNMLRIYYYSTLDFYYIYLSGHLFEKMTCLGQILLYFIWQTTNQHFYFFFSSQFTDSCPLFKEASYNKHVLVQRPLTLSKGYKYIFKYGAILLKVPMPFFQ